MHYDIFDEQTTLVRLTQTPSLIYPSPAGLDPEVISRVDHSTIVEV